MTLHLAAAAPWMATLGFVLGALACWLAWDGVRSGRTRGHLRRIVRRDDEPREFWIRVGLLAAFGVLLATASLVAALQPLWLR